MLCHKIDHVPDKVFPEGAGGREGGGLKRRKEGGRWVVFREGRREEGGWVVLREGRREEGGWS